jgi:hypothetical protein
MVISRGKGGNLKGTKKTSLFLVWFPRELQAKKWQTKINSHEKLKEEKN